MDIVDHATRSRMMSSIRGSDTKPEMMVRKYLHSRGFRYRLHRKDLPGSPDLVLKKHNLVIFVHGCFWHRHKDCHYAAHPKSRIEFWRHKFELNVERDVKAVKACRKNGWRVLIIWECGLKNEENQLHEISEIINAKSEVSYVNWPDTPPRLKQE